MSKKTLKGFTLIELIITIVILAIVASIGSLLLTSGFRSVFNNIELNDLSWQARVAKTRMQREIREVRAPNSSNIALSSSQLLFRNLTGTLIRYRRVDSQLRRNGRALADHVSQLSFNYLTTAGVVTSQLSQAAFIQINITFADNNMTLPITFIVRPRTFR